LSFSRRPSASAMMRAGPVQPLCRGALPPAETRSQRVPKAILAGK
jgi:hypothetical protein